MHGSLLFKVIAPLQCVLQKHSVSTSFRIIQLIKSRHHNNNLCRLYVSKSSNLHLNFLELDKVLSSAVCKEDVLKALHLQMSKETELSSSADVNVLSSVLHLLATNASNGLHTQLDMLYKSLKEEGYHIGQGVNTTIIRSYVARNMWKEAIDVLNYMDENQLMKHTRSYNPVITGLAEQGHSFEAFELFHKKITMFHSLANKKESVIRDTKMFVAMIHSCCISDNDSLEKPILRNVFNKHDSKDHETNLSHSEVKKIHSLVLRLFDFFHNFGIKIPYDILQACQKWFTFDQSNSWTFRNCGVNEAGKCNLCGIQLEKNIPNGYFNSLEKEILHLLSDANEGFKYSQEEIMELKGVHDTCLTNGPFDVIIDEQNLGLEGKQKDNNSTKLFGKRLLTVVDHFSKQQQKIFLPLHYKALENDISGNLLKMLRNYCEIWMIKSHINDDLLLLCAAASNGMHDCKTSLVSNDNWRDHSVMLSNNNNLKLLKWARLNHIMFEVKYKNHVSFFKNLFDPVVQRSEYAWHFPMLDGSWKCARFK